MSTGHWRPRSVVLQRLDQLPQARLERGSLTGPDQSLSLDPFDCREPSWCAVVVVSRQSPVRFDGGDIPPIAGVERRPQLFLTDGVRASIGTIITEAQHIQGSSVL